MIGNLNVGDSKKQLFALRHKPECERTKQDFFKPQFYFNRSILRTSVTKAPPSSIPSAVSR